MKNDTHYQNKKILFICVIIILTVTAIISVCVGKYEISVKDMIDIISGVGGDRMQEQVLWILRLPRTVMAIMAGAGLGMAGYVYQIVFKNPLASPDIIGIAGGANLGAAAAIVTISSANMVAIATGAFWGAFIAVVCVLLLVRITSSHSMATFVISGIIINAISKAAIMVLKYFADPQNELATMEYWEMGTFGNTTLSKVLSILPMFLVGMIGLILMHRQVGLMALSDAECRALGVRLKPVRTMILLLSTLVVSSVISITGLISFAGLIAPHIARLMLKKDDFATMIMSALMGSLIVTVADICARSLYSAELPVSIMTTAVGVPMLVYFLYKRGKENL